MCHVCLATFASPSCQNLVRRGAGDLRSQFLIVKHIHSTHCTCLRITGFRINEANSHVQCTICHPAADILPSSWMLVASSNNHLKTEAHKKSILSLETRRLNRETAHRAAAELERRDRETVPLNDLLDMSDPRSQQQHIAEGDSEPPPDPFVNYTWPSEDFRVNTTREEREEREHEHLTREAETYGLWDAESAASALGGDGMGSVLEEEVDEGELMLQELLEQAGELPTELTCPNKELIGIQV